MCEREKERPGCKYKAVNTKQKLVGAFKFKPIVHTMCAISNDGKRESVTVKGSRVWIGAVQCRCR